VEPSTSTSCIESKSTIGSMKQCFTDIHKSIMPADINQTPLMPPLPQTEAQSEPYDAVNEAIWKIVENDNHDELPPFKNNNITSTARGSSSTSGVTHNDSHDSQSSPAPTTTLLWYSW